jgi:hypothetical protein
MSIAGVVLLSLGQLRGDEMQAESMACQHPLYHHRADMLNMLTG